MVILVAEKSVNGGKKILKDVVYMLEHNVKISHATLQIETDECRGQGHPTIKG